MRKHSIAMLLGGSLSIAGCAAPQGSMVSEDEQNNLDPVICYEAKHCDAMWQRAQIWVINNAGYKIQIANDTVIQTYGPLRGDSYGLAFTVTKAPRGKGFFEIDSRASCGSNAGCSQHPKKERAALHVHLKATPSE